MLNSDRISAMTRAALTQTPLAKVEVVRQPKNCVAICMDVVAIEKVKNFSISFDIL